MSGFGYRDGLLVKNVGNLQPDDAICRCVSVGEKKLNGIIGTKPVHVLNEEDRKKPIELTDLTVDIGANTYEDAQKQADVGDVVCFVEPFCESDTKVMSKALERTGCFLLINLMRQELEYDTYFVFTTLSHINGAGIKTALFDLDIKNAVLINEISQDKDNSRKGAVIPLTGKRVVYSKNLTELVKNSGEDCSFVCDSENDTESVAVNMSQKNIALLRISYPTMYPNSVLKTAKKTDIEAVFSILKILLDCEKLA